MPYADFGDPQSLNLYTYVRNTPTTGMDTNGHSCDSKFCQIAAGVGSALVKQTPAYQIPHAISRLASAIRHPAAANAQGTALVKTLALASAAAGGDEKALKQLATSATTIWNGMSTKDKASTVTDGVLAVGAIAVGKIAPSSGSVSETTTVMHFTSDAGVAGITESGGMLRSGTYVTTPSQVPGGSSSAAVENILEIGPGKGANSVTFETPTSNLTVPENGPTTSGGAQQFQLKQPTSVDPSKFKKTPE